MQVYKLICKFANMYILCLYSELFFVILALFYLIPFLVFTIDV